MFARRVLVVALALLLVSAGCLGGGAGAESGSSDDGDAGSSGGSGEVGASESAANDPEDLDDLELSAAEAALRDAGSFTSTWRYGGTDAEGNAAEVSYTYYVDLDAGRSHVIVSTTEADQAAETGWEQFRTPETAYTRYGSGENAFYQVQADAGTDVVGDSLSRSGVYNYADTDDLSYEGTERYDGVSVKRYELTRAQSAFFAAGAAAGAGQNPDVEVQEFSYVVLVDEDGLARYESWSYTGVTSDGETIEATWEYSLTDVGSTSFEDPEWLAEADAQAQQSQG